MCFDGTGIWGGETCPCLPWAWAIIDLYQTFNLHVMNDDHSLTACVFLRFHYIVSAITEDIYCSV